MFLVLQSLALRRYCKFWTLQKTKATGFDYQNNNFARAITLLCTLLCHCDTTINNVKLPNFTFTGGREHIVSFCVYVCSVFFTVFFFFFILIFLQLLVRRILKNEGSRPTYRLLGYLSVFQLGVSLLLAIHQVRKLWSIHLIFLVKK